MPEPIDPPSASPPVGEHQPLNSIQRSVLESEVVAALQTIFDPEIPVNIYDLGLIYEVDISPTAHAKVTMTLTSPACPVAETLPGDVEATVAQVPGVRTAEVELVWEPPFSIDRIPEHIRLDLGLY